MTRRLAGIALGLLCVAGLAALVRQPRQVEIARYATPLDGRTRSQRHNADLALARLNGAVIAPGDTFSFNARVGSFSRDQGYRKAPVSYNGQLVDSWGGGVCQTSTTLYNAALLAGLEVKERHRHRFAPSYVPPGRDAAVAFDTIDLKIRNPYSFPVRIAAAETQDRVEIALESPKDLPVRPEIFADVGQVRRPGFYQIEGDSDRGRIRNSGKLGWQVAVYRITGDRKELISADNYPAMNRIVERP